MGAKITQHSVTEVREAFNGVLLTMGDATKIVRQNEIVAVMIRRDVWPAVRDFLIQHLADPETPPLLLNPYPGVELPADRAKRKEPNL